MASTVRVQLLASSLLAGALTSPHVAAAQAVAPQDTALRQPAGPQADAATADVPAQGADIVVTGSLIRNPNLVASSPVTAIGTDEIALRQANMAEALLRDLPGVVPSIGSAVNVGNEGASFVNLRGLGPNRNLVLLDGVRLTPGTLTGQFDLNNIPLALVRRVDVLTGGASTTYGADAISGVVNFVTRSDFTGLDLTLSDQISERGDGHIVRADLTTGADFADDRGNAVLSIGYQQSDPVLVGSRADAVVPVNSFTGGIGGSGTTVPTRLTGVNPTGADSITAGCGTGFPVACNAVQGSRQINAAGTAFNTAGTFTPFNFNPDTYFQTPFKRFNAYAAARYQLAEGVEAYSRAIYSHNEVNVLNAPSGAFGLGVSISLNNPFLSTAQRNALCAFDTSPGAGYTPRIGAAACNAAATATGPGDPNYRQVDNISLSRRTTEAGPRTFDFTTGYFDYRAGLRGGIAGDLGYDLFGSYGISETNQQIGGHTVNSRIAQALLVSRAADGTVTCQSPANGCVPLNVFGPEGSITAAQVAFIRQASTIQTRVTQAQAHALVSGGIGITSPLADEAISIALGGEYRNYTASQQADQLSAAGELGGSFGATQSFRGGYDVAEAIGEVIVPLVADRPFVRLLQVEGGIRYSRYGIDAAGAPSYGTTTWKAAGAWAPARGLKLRGNYARAVRAPNIGELFRPASSGLVNLSNDPCASLTNAGGQIAGRPVPTGTLRDVCLAQGAPATAIGAIPQPTSGQANFTGGGNPGLGPETSDSWSAGAVVTPSALPGFSLSMDYYNVAVKGAITAPTPGDVIGACFGTGNPGAASAASAACTGIRRNPIDGSLSGDFARTPGLPISLSNLGRLQTDGIDLAANYGRAIGPVQLALAFTGNWTNRSRFQATPSAIDRECVGRYSVNCASIQPEFQWSQRTTLGYGGVDLSLMWRHISAVEYELADTAPAYAGPVPLLRGEVRDFNSIPAYDLFDLTVRVVLDRSFALTLGAMNLFDRQPPFVGQTIGTTAFNSGNTYPATYDAVGRRYAASVRVRF